MEFNYKLWCLNQLTKTEFIVYDIIYNLGVGSFTFQEIANHVKSSHNEIVRIVKRLENKKLLLAYTSGGLYTLWIRSHPEEEMPDKEDLIKEASAIVRSPQGEDLFIPPNGIYEFARTHEIVPMTLWNLLHCKAASNRKGWELIKGFSSNRKIPIANSKEILCKMIIESEILQSQYDSLKKEHYELKIETQDLRRQVKDSLSEKPGTVSISVKYLNELKEKVRLLENENAWLKNPNFKGVA